MMILKCLLVALVAMIGLSSVHSAKSDELSPEKLIENFKKINAHLDKTTQSDDSESLMTEVEKMLNKKSSSRIQMGGKSLIKTLEMLVDLSNAASDLEHCSEYVKTKALEKLDTGLRFYPRSREVNYIPTKVDLLIEQLAYKVVRRCDWDRKFSFLEVVHREGAWDEILKHTYVALTNGVKQENDIKKYINELVPQDGVVAVAGKQYLALESILNEDSCNEKGYEVLLKNDLAMRNRIFSLYHFPEQNLDTVPKLEQQLLNAVTKHEEICRPIARESFKSAIKTLDQETYRKVLAVIASHYLDRDLYPKIIESVNKKEVDEDFTIPLMNDHARELLARSTYFAEAWKIRSLRYTYQQRILLRTYLKALDSEGKKRKLEDKSDVDSVIVEYLIEPCEKYLKVMGPIVEVHLFGMPVNYPKTAADELIKDMTYNMVYSGYQACMWVVTNRSFIFDETDSYPL